MIVIRKEENGASILDSVTGQKDYLTSAQRVTYLSASNQILIYSIMSLPATYTINYADLDLVPVPVDGADAAAIIASFFFRKLRAAGNDGNVQYNKDGELAGEDEFYYNDLLNELTLNQGDANIRLNPSNIVFDTPAGGSLLLQPPNPANDRTQSFQDRDGTIALVEDLSDFITLESQTRYWLDVQSSKQRGTVNLYFGQSSTSNALVTDTLKTVVPKATNNAPLLLRKLQNTPGYVVVRGSTVNRQDFDNTIYSYLNVVGCATTEGWALGTNEFCMAMAVWGNAPNTAALPTQGFGFVVEEFGTPLIHPNYIWCYDLADFDATGGSVEDTGILIGDVFLNNPIYEFVVISDYGFLQGFIKDPLTHNILWASQVTPIPSFTVGTDFCPQIKIFADTRNVATPVRQCFQRFKAFIY
jgi:hypothetical protein